MFKNRCTLFIVLATMLMLCSCVDQWVEKPTFTLKDVSLDMRSSKELNALLTVDVRNPNRFSLYVDSVDYRFSIDNHEAVRGRFAESFEVQPASVKEVPIPLTLGMNGLGSPIGMLIRGKGIPYKIEGTLHLKVLWSRMAIPFAKEGSFKIRL